MALLTKLRIFSHDAQGLKDTLEFGIVDAGYGDTTIPTAAKIKAVVNAIYGAAKISSNHVTGWEVAIVEGDNTGAAGGSGDVSSSTAVRVRNDNDGLEPFMFSIPGLRKSGVVIDPRNRSSVVMTGGLWTALRDALTDEEIGFTNPSGGTVAEATQIAMSGEIYDGKRKAPQPA